MLCTRLCHDITGPVGAIANGAEFLAEGDSGMQEQAIELITQSAQEAVNRLQFYRMAYGRVNQKGEASLADCKALIQSFFQAGKVMLDWPDQYTDAAGVPVTRGVARLIFNMVILAVGTLIRGGVVSIRVLREGGQGKVVVSANGQAIKWDEKIQKALNHQITVDELEPSTVQAYFTHILANESQVDIETCQSGEVFEIIARMREEAVN